MKTNNYYVHHTSCRIHNRKTEALDLLLKRFNDTAFSFDDDFTIDSLHEFLTERVAEINCKFRGHDIDVRLLKFDTVTFAFSDSPNSGNDVASIILYPVKNFIDSSNWKQS